jgi:hypothetical protein
MSTTSSDIAKFLWPGLKALFNTTYNDYPKEYAEIFDEVSSDKAYEEYQGMVGLGLARKKAEQSGVYYDSFTQGFNRRVANVAYALGYIVPWEAVKDNQYMKLTKARTKALARSERQTKEIVAANILNRAFNSSYTYATGKELCATDHITKTGLTYKNELTTAADLSEAAIEQALIDISDFVDERGLRIAAKAKKLIIPKELQFEAKRILNSSLQNDSANNAINALKDVSMQVCMNHYLEDPDAWFIKTDISEGLIYQNREEPIFENDTDFNSKNLLFTVYSRYNFDAADVRGIFGSPGA